MSAEAHGLAKNLIRPEQPRHQYLSTACLHDMHDRCRLTCKFCDIPCNCPCHDIAAHAPDGQARTEGEVDALDT